MSRTRRVLRELRARIYQPEAGVWRMRLSDGGIKKVNIDWLSTDAFPSDQLDVTVGLWRRNGRLPTPAEISPLVFLPQEGETGRRHIGAGGCEKITYWPASMAAPTECSHCHGPFPTIQTEPEPPQDEVMARIADEVREAERPTLWQRIRRRFGRNPEQRANPITA